MPSRNQLSGSWDALALVRGPHRAFSHLHPRQELTPLQHQSMNSSAALDTTDNYSTQHGQPGERHNSAEMDTVSRNAGGLERVPKSNVVDITVNTTQSTSDAHLAPGTSTSDAAALPSPLASSSLSPQTDDANAFTPLRICQKGKASFRVSETLG